MPAMINADLLPEGALYADGGRDVTIDGTKTAGEWDDAIELGFPTEGGQCVVHIKEDSQHLLVAHGLPGQWARLRASAHAGSERGRLRSAAARRPASLGPRWARGGREYGDGDRLEFLQSGLRRMDLGDADIRGA